MPNKDNNGLNVIAYTPIWNYRGDYFVYLGNKCNSETIK